MSASLEGRETVLMLDQKATRRYHLTRECPHIADSERSIRRLPVDDREVERALLCTYCQREIREGRL